MYFRVSPEVNSNRDFLGTNIILAHVNTQCYYNMKRELNLLGT